jgi:hypothetical protein
MAGHLYAFGSTAEMRRVEVRGCRGRGKRDDPPFDHYTGRGRVAVHRGAYFDAFYNKKSKVVLVLVDTFGGIVDETMEELKRLQRRSTGPGAVDRTRYGRHRCSSPHTFIVHHMQRLSAAAVLYDVKAIKKGAVALKQQACNVRPVVVVGAGAAAHAARGAGECLGAPSCFCPSGRPLRMGVLSPPPVLCM